MFNWYKKEKPFFTGIARGIGGFGFGASAAGGPGSGIVASGGTLSAGLSVGDYVYHVWTQPGSFDIESVGVTNNTIEFLVIGGGGGASEYQGGGGGAGGAAYASAWTLTSADVGSHSIEVGTGGAGAPSSGSANTNGSKGGNTIFNLSGNAITGLGGGGGIRNNYGSPSPFNPTAEGGCSGGAGGGGLSVGPNSFPASQPGQPTFGGKVINYGNVGGNQTDTSGGTGGGGGGLGGAAPERPSTYNKSPADPNPGRAGGLARAFPWCPAPAISPQIPSGVRSSWTSAVGPTGLFGGGGGGGGGGYGGGDSGGGGAGNGGAFPDNAGEDAIDFTGSGGGGSTNTTYNAGNGGDGIVILRYSKTGTPDLSATGGTSFTFGGKVWHFFTSTSSENFVVTSVSGTADLTADILMVGGGGGGANGQSGGGAGGVVLQGNSKTISPGTYPIVAGAGGADAPGTSSYATNGGAGGNTTAFGCTARGGGGGSRNNYAYAGNPDQTPLQGGNSGGGGGGGLSGPSTPMTSARLPNSGGPLSLTVYGGYDGAPAANLGDGSGGGGAGAGGASPGPGPTRPSSTASPGGPGAPFPAYPGPGLFAAMPSPLQSVLTPDWATAVSPLGAFGGGGGGGDDNNNGGGGSGGQGGGGRGGDPGQTPQAGTHYTGGGGGDRGAPGSAGPTRGGNGIVIISYPQ